MVFVAKNPARCDARLTYEADGLPKLPAYNDEWTVAEARAALDTWFHAMWGKSFSLMCEYLIGANASLKSMREIKGHTSLTA